MTFDDGQLTEGGRLNTDRFMYRPMATEPLASFIFPDIGALHVSKLESFVNLNFKEVEVHGFEIYIVEQWAAERKLSTIITSYTGNSQDVVHAVQVVLPKNPEKWPGSLRKYFEDLSHFSQPKQMSKGTLFVTNLASVPSALNLLHVECGDLRVIWTNFKANYDLKKMRCGGRSALLLCAPSSAAEDKFSQLYKIPICSELRQRYLQQIELEEFVQPSRSLWTYNPVIELITLLQTSLSYFHLYHGDKDGLLCEGTEKAISSWWAKYGKFYLGLERPKNEGTLGPTTVAALISLVLSCYFKLKVEDCTSSKDPFEEEDFITSIHIFQKKYGLPKGHGPVYLDDKTLEKLFEVSAKTSNTDIFKFKKVVKSTVQDIAGKGNPMHLSNEILTTDLDFLVKNVHGGSLGLLWKSKGRPRGRIRRIWDRPGFCHIRYFRGNPDALLERQAIYFDEMRNNGVDIESSESFDQDKQVFDNKLIKYNTSSSSISASSMVCNYDKNKYARNFGTNKLYHGEYFRRNSLPFADDKTQGLLDDEIPLEDERSRCMYRSNSFSQVQDTTDSWELPFDPSLVRMARDMLKIKHKLELQQRRDEMAQGYMGEHEGKSACDESRAIFNDLLTDLQNDYQNYTHRVNDLDKKHEEIETKQVLLKGEMRELNSLSSKFQYDMRILEVRMRDVEESVRQFDSKLAAVQKSLVDQGLGIATAVDSLSDKARFDICVHDLVHAENTGYEGFCLKVLSKKFVEDVEETIKVWGMWLCEKMSYRNQLGNTEKT